MKQKVHMHDQVFNKVEDIMNHYKRNSGIHLSWDRIRDLLSIQQCITITLLINNNETIHLRTMTQAEVRQPQPYTALSSKPNFIGRCKTIIDNKRSVASGMH